MKARIIFVLVLLSLMSTRLLANDTIITKNAERLIVKITEVSSQEVKYKELDNLDGPVFVLNAADINTIIFNNGSIKTFNNLQSNKIAQAANTCGATRIRNNQYNVNGETMSHDQFKDYLRINDPDAYGILLRGERLNRAGAGLLITGLALDLSGLTMFFTSSNRGVHAAGYIMAGIGGILEISCIPTLIVGSSKIRQSAEIYTRNCERKQNYAVTLTPGITSNGLGLVLRF